MTFPKGVAGLLVCAGLSERFGPEDKMMADLSGRPLALHAAGILSTLPLAGRIAVLRPDQHDLAARLRNLSFETAINPRPEDGRDSSIRVGLQAAIAHDVRGVIFCLGDMPRITPDLLGKLAASDPVPALCAHEGLASPPAYFPRTLIAGILRDGDTPIRAVVARSEPAHVPADAEILADIDTPSDLRHAHAHGTACHR